MTISDIVVSRRWEIKDMWDRDLEKQHEEEVRLACVRLLDTHFYFPQLLCSLVICYSDLVRLLASWTLVFISNSFYVILYML